MYIIAQYRAPIFFLGNICKSSRSCQPLAVKSHLLESSLLAVGGSKITVVPFAASSKRRIQYYLVLRKGENLIMKNSP